MKNITFTFFAILLMLLLGNTLKAQENIILRTDRDLYVTGEPAWVHVNCIRNGSDTGSLLSTVAYIEILNSHNQPVLQKCLHLDDGMADARIFIPDTLKTGNYILRGYTQWMRNYNQRLFAHNIISILNPFKSDKFPASDVDFSKDTVIFYPEGGDILVNQNNHMVVQLLDKYGKGREINALLLANNTDTIASFKSNKAGFTKFNFVAKDQVSYMLEYSVDTLVFSHQLPKASQKGKKLTLSVNSKEVIIDVIATGWELDFHGYVDIVSSEGELLKSFNFKPTETISIDKKLLPKGYLCAYLYDAKHKRLSSRYFMANESRDNMEAEIILSKKAYTTHEKISVSIENIKNLKDVSIAVVQAALVEEKNWISIPENLHSYSTNTLAAYTGPMISINDILQCFKPVNSIKRSDIQSVYLPEKEARILSGTFVDRETQAAISDKKLMLNIVGRKSGFDISTTDSLGKFKFLVDEYGDKEMVIQPFEQIDTTELKYNIDLDDIYSKQYPESVLPNFVLPESKIEAINNSIVNMQLSAVYNSDSLNVKLGTLNVGYDSFYGSPEHEISMTKYITLTSMEEIIRELVPLTFIQKRKGKSRINIVEPSGLNKSEGEAFVMVDGVFIRDIDKLLAIPAADLERIELINLNYYFKGVELGRILAFYTHEGNLSSYEFDDHIFRQIQTFYEHPLKYNAYIHNNSDIDKNLPDYRNMLYWKAGVINTDIEFYSADNKGKYTVVVKGINEYGKSECYQSSFKVE